VTFANLPTITLQSATAVATSSATLNATILNDGNASSTNKGFIYGTTTSYGSLINLSGSYGEGAFSSGISNLIPNTTYHYVAFVTNSAGTATSTDGTLTTSATSSAVSGCGTYVYTSGNTTYQVTCGITTVLSVAPSSTGSTGGGSGGGASVTGSNTTSTVVAVNLGPVYSVTPVLAPITVSVATTTISLPADTSSPTSTLAVVPTVATSTPDQAMMPIAACPVGYTCIPATGLSDSSSIAPSSVIPAGAAASHAGTSAGGTPAASVSFGGNLQLGSSGSDVKQLQAFLNIHGFPVSSSGAGSTGHETSYFGPATKAALAKFQKANGIRPAVGYFGPITRSYVNAS